MSETLFKTKYVGYLDTQVSAVDATVIHDAAVCQAIDIFGLTGLRLVPSLIRK